MLGTIQPTPYDLVFRLFGIPIRIHPTYWLISLLFVMQTHISFWPILLGCMFLSLLLHEMGHALAFRYYGMYSHIVLYSFGGYAMPEGRLPVRMQRIVVTLAGPFTNFLIVGIVFGTNYVQPWEHINYIGIAYDVLLFINLFLGLVNLLPVFPLDGGQISREIWLKYRPGMGVIYSLRMSLIVAIAFSAYAFGCHFDLIPRSWTIYWLRPGLFAAILFAILAVMNYQQLQYETRRGSFWDDREPWR